VRLRLRNRDAAPPAGPAEEHRMVPGRWRHPARDHWEPGVSTAPPGPKSTCLNPGRKSSGSERQRRFSRQAAASPAMTARPSPCLAPPAAPKNTPLQACSENENSCCTRKEPRLADRKPSRVQRADRPFAGVGRAHETLSFQRPVITGRYGALPPDTRVLKIPTIPSFRPKITGISRFLGYCFHD
jgi:hypothetical protein